MTPEHAGCGRERALLTGGSVELMGRILRSSNETFLVQLSRGEDTAEAIYKPVAGARPLSAIEPGLHRRERAAYLLSEALGWGMVPPTVIREDAPLRVGSLQWFVDCDFREHYFTLAAEDPCTHPDLVRMALFDYVANNTDRKSGHGLRGDDGLVPAASTKRCIMSVQAPRSRRSWAKATSWSRVRTSSLSRTLRR